MAVTKKLRDNDTGKVYSVNFDSEPTQEDLAEAFDYAKSQDKSILQNKADASISQKSTTEKVLGTVASGLSGAAQGLTLGGFGKILPKSYQKGIEELKKDYPGAYAVGDIASYAGGLPELAGKGIIKAGAKVGSKVLPVVKKPVLGLAARLTGKAAEGAAIGGAVEGAKGTVGGATEDVSAPRGLEQAKGGVAGGGVFGGGVGAIGEGVKATAKIAPKLADNIVRTVIRAGKKGEVEGFDPSNMVKHNLLGKDIDEMAAKTKLKLDELRGQLKDIQASGKAKDVTVDVVESIKNARKELLGNNKINFHDKQKASKLLDEIEENAWGSSNAGKFDLADAMSYKTDTGEKGYFAKSAMHSNPDLTASEKVYNTVYRHVKEAINNEIEKADIGDIRKINKQFEEIIPVSNAIARRIGTLKGNMAISPLELLLGGGTLVGAGIGAVQGGKEGGAAGALGGLATVAAARSLRSPTVAKKLFGLGSRLEGKSPSISNIYRPGDIAGKKIITGLKNIKIKKRMSRTPPSYNPELLSHYKR